MIFQKVIAFVNGIPENWNDTAILGIEQMETGTIRAKSLSRPDDYSKSFLTIGDWRLLAKELEKQVPV